MKIIPAIDYAYLYAFFVNYTNSNQNTQISLQIYSFCGVEIFKNLLLKTISIMCQSTTKYLPKNL